MVILIVMIVIHREMREVSEIGKGGWKKDNRNNEGERKIKEDFVDEGKEKNLKLCSIV